MKRIVLIFCLSLATCLTRAQLPFIGTATIIPQNPTSADFIKIVTNVTTPNQGILVDISHTVTGQQINLNTCYWQGMLTATQNYIDTFMIGPLAAGSYQIIHKAYMSTTQQWCNKTDSNAVTKSFQVSGPTAIHKNRAATSFEVYPNPTRSKVSISTNLAVDEVLVFSSLGALVLRTEPNHVKEIDVSELKEGLYIMRILSGGKLLYTRFIKSSRE